MTNVGGGGSSFRISFSEEKPEPKVSKLTLSSDFTHSYEESYEDEDDVLVVDIDYGGGNEVDCEKESDSQESLSRTSSLSNSIKKEKPKFGLRRFKSVEEIIDVSPAKGKDKLKKTVSDYGSRFKGFEKKEAKLTLSADFTRSWEENFEDDGEVLVVDIDYSKKDEEKSDQSLEDNLFSASDHFGHVNTGNENGFRKYKSHEDVRSPSYKHRELERSASGYEITFIDESSPDEIKRLSLSADLVSSNEEILDSTEAVSQQRLQNEGKIGGKEFFNAEVNYATSTPQKSSKNMEFRADAYRQGALVFEEKPGQKAVKEEEANPVCIDDSESEPVHTEKPPDLLSNINVTTEFKQNGYVEEKAEISPAQRKEGESSMMDIEKDRLQTDSNGMKYAVETRGFGGSSGSVHEANAESDPTMSQLSLGADGEEPKYSDNDEIVTFALPKEVDFKISEFQTTDLSDNEMQHKESDEVIDDEMKIDLDDILIIDIASNDQHSIAKINDEASPLEGNHDHVDDTDTGGISKSKRAEVYIYSLNQSEKIEDADVVEKSTTPNNLQKEESLSPSSSGSVQPVGEKSTDDAVKKDEGQNDGENKERPNTEGQNISQYFEDCIDEEPNTSLQQADTAGFGDKMRLLDLVTTSGNDINESDEEHEDDNNLSGDSYSMNRTHNNEDDFSEREDVILDETRELYENRQRSPKLAGNESDDSRNSEDKMAAEDVKETEPDRSILESSEDTRDMNANDEYLEPSKVDVSKQDDKKSEMEANEITDQLESAKFFKMIIISEEGSDDFDDDDDDVGVDNTRRCVNEYIFPMPLEMELMSEIIDNENEDNVNDVIDTQRVSLGDDDDAPNEAGDESKENRKGRLWWSFWIFRKRSPKNVRSSTNKSHDEFTEGPIPNGACKTSDDYDDDVISSTKGTGSGNDDFLGEELPKRVNKVYRLKNFHHGRKILTETIRIFLQQEDALSLIWEPGYSKN